MVVISYDPAFRCPGSNKWQVRIRKLPRVARRVLELGEPVKVIGCEPAGAAWGNTTDRYIVRRGKHYYFRTWCDDESESKSWSRDTVPSLDEFKLFFAVEEMKHENESD